MFRLKADFTEKTADRRGRRSLQRLSLLLLTFLSVLCASGIAAAGTLLAVVPTRIIYPGEELQAAQLEEVEVTNPNIAPGYAQSISEVRGLITKRTLLPGRIILVSSLREAFAVSRGSSVKLMFEKGPLRISAVGTPLQDAAVGELIRVRNKDSGIIVSGTVMADGTVHVVAK